MPSKNLKHKRIIISDFVTKALLFLNFPEKILLSDIKTHSSEIAELKGGKSYIKKSAKMLEQLQSVEKTLKQIQKQCQT